MNDYLVAPSNLSIEDRNDWFPPVVDGHFGGERVRDLQRITREC